MENDLTPSAPTANTGNSDCRQTQQTDSKRCAPARPRSMPNRRGIALEEIDRGLVGFEITPDARK